MPATFKQAFIKHLTRHQPTSRQTHVQQARRAFGVVHFQRVLQYQHLDFMLNRPYPLADTDACRAQAGLANRPLLRRGVHVTCQSLEPGMPQRVE